MTVPAYKVIVRFGCHFDSVSAVMTSTMQVNFPAPSTLYMNLIAHWSMERQKCPSSSRNQGGDGKR